MKPICTAIKEIALGLVLFASAGIAQATLINGDFETNSISPWTSFTTSNGTLGAGRPTISSFDVAGNGLSSLSLGLSVGYLTAPCAYPGVTCPSKAEGGGIRQTASFLGGLTFLHADVAVANSSIYGGYNADGGTFSLLLDGLLLDSFSVGNIAAGTVQRGYLDFTTVISAGMHSLEILVTRDYGASLSLTQYVDNVSASSVPTPSTLSLACLGILGLVALKRKAAEA